MKNITVYHYKNYNKVQINNITRANVLQAGSTRHEVELLTEKPTSIVVDKKAFNKFEKENNQEELLKNTPINDFIVILGVAFLKVSDNSDFVLNDNGAVLQLPTGEKVGAAYKMQGQLLELAINTLLG